MKRLQALLLVLLIGFSIGTQAEDSLKALIEKVRREAQQDRHYDKNRELRFLQERDRQQERLAELRAKLKRANAQADALRSAFRANEAQLSALDQQIATQAGDLNDLFAIVRQNAAETDALLNRSMISAQYPDRGVFIKKLMQREQALSMATLNKLWLVLLNEMYETGKVVRFNGPVISPDGEEQTKTITRIGVFDALADGKFLRYLPESRKVMELVKQPAGRYQDMAKAFEQASDGWQPMAVDPSKGAILALLVQSPDFRERLRQSGVIGYLILTLGAIGLLIVCWRETLLLYDGWRVKRQLTQQEADDGNPLGRLITTVTTAQCRNSETIAVRLDETVSEESHRLFFGLTALSVFAAVTPLLGLLGTVIGMIETFQSISLFGTGDPKLMAGGISYALITTELGLAVAIPLLLLQSFLHAQANRIVEILDQQSALLFEKYDQRLNPASAQ